MDKGKGKEKVKDTTPTSSPTKSLFSPTKSSQAKSLSTPKASPSRSSKSSQAKLLSTPKASPSRSSTSSQAKSLSTPKHPSPSRSSTSTSRSSPLRSSVSPTKASLPTKSSPSRPRSSTLPTKASSSQSTKASPSQSSSSPSKTSISKGSSSSPSSPKKLSPTRSISLLKIDKKPSPYNIDNRKLTNVDNITISKPFPSLENDDSMIVVENDDSMIVVENDDSMIVVENDDSMMIVDSFISKVQIGQYKEDEQNDDDLNISFDDDTIIIEIVQPSIEDKTTTATTTATTTTRTATTATTTTTTTATATTSESVFDRLYHTPIHHLTDSNSHNHYYDHHHDHHQDHHQESVFDRLYHTPIHHLTDSNSHNHYYDHHHDHHQDHRQDYHHTPTHHLTSLEKLNSQQSPQPKPTTGRVTYNSLSNRIQGLTPDVTNNIESVIHAVVLLTTVPALVDEPDEINFIATSILEDCINTLSKLKEHSNNKLIVAIPEYQRENINKIFEKLKVLKLWSTLTIPNDVPSLDNVITEDLTELLKYTLKTIGPSTKGSISFVASDCPTLPLTEIILAQTIASEEGNFYISPASDGGYGLLTIPADTPNEIFDNIKWSTENTCIQQILRLRNFVASKSPEKKQIVIVGKTHRDIDNNDDLKYLKNLIENDEDKEFIKNYPLTVKALSTFRLN